MKAKVAKSSGANYGFHKEQSKPMPEAGPVVSSFLSFLLLFARLIASYDLRT